MRVIVSKYNLKGKEDIKIVHFSDVHFHTKYSLKNFKIILDKTKLLNPDYICITGDLIDNNYELDEEIPYKLFRNWLLELGKITKVIISLGNHEMKIKKHFTNEMYHKILNKLDNINNVIILDNQTYIENKLCFIGYNPPYIYYKKKEKDSIILVEDFNSYKFNINEENYNILLIHTPTNLLTNDIYNKLNDFSKIDLILAGHTHGGMMPIKIKGNRGIISPTKRLFPKDVRGKLIRGETTLIICSGIIRLSKASLLFKYFNNVYAANINEITIKEY